MNKKEETFTIGDKTNNGTISKFEVDSNGIRVFFEEKPKNYHVSLNSIKHVKQPLFTTEDGVDIFEGDRFYFIAANNKDLNQKFGSLIAFKHAQAEYAIARFSTEAKAEEYIIMNKPCLSINDLFSYTDIVNLSFDKIKELVKSKL